ncbi:GntR family transcriptional regulator [Terrabacter sp. GCM10028922]|jgi:DNA-binding GntR family transcriptional regulator|uniref:GntR family transcriptional regulator n=1 Tax=Terrabacter sp. GCM10028922 TaxID=3273428 RepID=UPI0036071BBA
MAQNEVALIAALEQERALLGRTSTAERVAGLLRERIMAGAIPPSTRLSEDAISRALGVSRNTLREAFRLLAHERLLVHELNRGVFVRRLTPEDLSDLFQVRRLVELGALRGVRAVGPERVVALRAALDEARQAAVDGRWMDVGTANMRFHLAIAALAGSPRVGELMEHVLAELRLVFLVMPDPRRFHEPYIERNAEICRLLEAGQVDAAHDALVRYLDDAERELLRAL